MRHRPKRGATFSGRSASSSTDAEDEEPPSPRTPAPSPYAFPNSDNEDEDEDEEEEEEEEEDEGNLLEILIETLTGTTFHVRVSPWETGEGLKGLLQRTQGLPSSHQHILNGTTELTDDAPLIDQGVQDGARLRLVLAMKGGPMNSRRIPAYDENLWKEFSEYMELNSEELWDNEPGKPVTLLVLREGDAVNLYRVIQNDDGTFSPLNESWSSNRSGSGRTDGTSDRESLMEETVKHQQKMVELNARMEALKLKNVERKKKQKNQLKPSSPRVKVSSAGRSRRGRLGLSQPQKPKKESNEEGRNKVAKSAAKVPERPMRTPSRISRLPPVLPNSRLNHGQPLSRPTTQESSSELRRPSISRGSKILDELPKRPQPRHVEFSHHRKLESIGSYRERKGSLQTLKENSGHDRETEEVKSDQRNKYNAYRESLVRHGRENQEGRNETAVNAPRDSWSGRDVPFPLYLDHGRRRKNRYKTRLNQSHNIDTLRPPKEFDDRPKTSPEILERRTGSAATSSTMSDRINLRAPDEKLKELITILNTSRANSRLSERSEALNSIPPRSRKNSQDISKGTKSHARNLHLSGRTSLSMSLASLHESTPPQTAATQAGIENWLNNASQGHVDVVRNSVKQNPPSTSRRSTPEGGKKVFRRPGSGQFKASLTPRGFVPVTPKRKTNKIRPRCNKCSKKIGVVTSYSCRCGQMFCAQHRYSEAHECTYDYKSAGKKLIEIANPLVVPPKLPKI